jgi:hypothetical protein
MCVSVHPLHGAWAYPLGISVRGTAAVASCCTRGGAAILGAGWALVHATSDEQGTPPLASTRPGIYQAYAAVGISKLRHVGYLLIYERASVTVRAPSAPSANDLGQLGLGDKRARGGDPNDMGTNLPPLNFGPGLSAVAIAAGCNHTCALLQPGSVVKCWG